MSFARTVALLAFGFGGLACAATDGVTQDSSDIQGGAIDDQSTFALGVCRGLGPGRCQGVCSGTLVLPNVVATARHCVQESPPQVTCDAQNPSVFGGLQPGAFYVTTNTAMLDGNTQSGWFRVKSLVVPVDARVCGFDIALLVLENDVPPEAAKPVVPSVDPPMWDTSRYGKTFSAIGYGSTGPNGTDSGTRRKRSGLETLCIPGSPNQSCGGVHPNEFIGTDGTCHGDSGSGAYDESALARGEPVSFGVLSRGGSSEDGTRCEKSAYTRFDMFKDMLFRTALSASDNWNRYPAPAWAAGATPNQ